MLPPLSSVQTPRPLQTVVLLRYCYKQQARESLASSPVANNSNKCYLRKRWSSQWISQICGSKPQLSSPMSTTYNHCVRLWLSCDLRQVVLGQVPRQRWESHMHHKIHRQQKIIFSRLLQVKNYCLITGANWSHWQIIVTDVIFFLSSVSKLLCS